MCLNTDRGNEFWYVQLIPTHLNEHKPMRLWRENIVRISYCNGALKDIWDHWPHQCFVRKVRMWIWSRRLAACSTVINCCTLDLHLDRLSFLLLSVSRANQGQGSLHLSVQGYFFCQSQEQDNRAANNAWINNTQLTAAQSHQIMMIKAPFTFTAGECRS